MPFLQKADMNKANANIAQKGITVFLPEIEVWSKRKDRKKKIAIPLFPGYLFIETADLNNETKLAVLKSDMGQEDKGLEPFQGFGQRAASPAAALSASSRIFFSRSLDRRLVSSSMRKKSLSRTRDPA